MNDILGEEYKGDSRFVAEVYINVFEGAFTMGKIIEVLIHKSPFLIMLG